MVSNDEFKNLTTNIIAELENRTFAISEDERKAISQTWNQKHGNGSGNSLNASQDISDRYGSAHSRIFNQADSIASHWAANRKHAKTPHARPQIIAVETPGKRRLLSQSNNPCDASGTPSKRQRVDSESHGASKAPFKSPLPQYMLSTPRRSSALRTTSNSKSRTRTVRKRTPSSVRKINQRKHLAVNRSGIPKLSSSSENKSVANPNTVVTSTFGAEKNSIVPSISATPGDKNKGSVPSYMRSTASHMSKKSLQLPKPNQQSDPIQLAPINKATSPKSLDLEASLKKSLSYKPHEWTY